MSNTNAYTMAGKVNTALILLTRAGWAVSSYVWNDTMIGFPFGGTANGDTVIEAQKGTASLQVIIGNDDAEYHYSNQGDLQSKRELKCMFIRSFLKDFV
jgi:hypothetical protein